METVSTVVTQPLSMAGLSLAGLSMAFRIEPTFLQQTLLRLFRHFPAAEGRMVATVAVWPAGPGVRMEVLDEAGRVIVSATHADRGVKTWFKNRVLCAVFRLQGAKVLGLHGCAFTSPEGRATVLVGPNGTGKSTLTALACRTGGGYLSDDVILFDPLASRVLPYPILISRKCSPAGPCRFGLPRLTQVARTPQPLGALVFPRFIPGSPGSLHSLRASETMRRILRNARNAPVLGPNIFDIAAQLVDDVPAYELISGSRTQAAALLAEIHRQAGPARTTSPASKGAKDG